MRGCGDNATNSVLLAGCAEGLCQRFWRQPSALDKAGRKQPVDCSWGQVGLGVSASWSDRADFLNNSDLTAKKLCSTVLGLIAQELRLICSL